MRFICECSECKQEFDSPRVIYNAEAGAIVTVSDEAFVQAATCTQKIDTDRYRCTYSDRNYKLWERR